METRELLEMASGTASQHTFLRDTFLPVGEYLMPLAASLSLRGLVLQQSDILHGQVTLIHQQAPEPYRYLSLQLCLKPDILTVSAV